MNTLQAINHEYSTPSEHSLHASKCEISIRCPVLGEVLLWVDTNSFTITVSLLPQQARKVAAGLIAIADIADGLPANASEANQ